MRYGIAPPNDKQSLPTRSPVGQVNAAAPKVKRGLAFIR
jgi:hypothetical protein